MSPRIRCVPLPSVGPTGFTSGVNRPVRASQQSSPSLKAAADSKSRCATTSPKSSPGSHTHLFSASQNLPLRPGPPDIRSCQPCGWSDGYAKTSVARQFRLQQSVPCPPNLKCRAPISPTRFHSKAERVGEVGGLEASNSSGAAVWLWQRRRHFPGLLSRGQ